MNKVSSKPKIAKVASNPILTHKKEQIDFAKSTLPSGSDIRFEDV